MGTNKPSAYRDRPRSVEEALSPSWPPSRMSGYWAWRAACLLPKWPPRHCSPPAPQPQLTHVQSLFYEASSFPPPSLFLSLPTKLPKNRCHLLLNPQRNERDRRASEKAIKESIPPSVRPAVFVMKLSCQKARCRQQPRKARSGMAMGEQTGMSSKQLAHPPLSAMSQLRGADYP